MKFRFYAIKLSLLLVLIFIAQVLFSGFTERFVLDENSWGEPWRFLTAIFLHGGVGHVAYNIFALIMFGSMLETLIGGKNFLRIYLISGILANVVSVNFYSSSLGASGAIFGIIGALIAIRPLLPVFAFGLPMPIIVAGFFWAVGDIVGIFIPDNVGNIAHLSGMFFGYLIGRFFRKKRRVVRREKLDIDEKTMREWENGYLR